MPPKSLPKSTALSLKFLASARILVGISTVLVPRHSAFLFGLTSTVFSAADPAAGMNVVARLFGVRDAVMGGYLWRSLSDFNSNRVSRGETQRHIDVDGTRGFKHHDGGGVIGEVSPLLPSNTTPTQLNTQDTGVKSTTAEPTSHAAALSTQRLRDALYIGLICDSIDVLSCLACYLESGMSVRAIILTAGGAVLFACLGVNGLRGLKSVQGLL